MSDFFEILGEKVGSPPKCAACMFCGMVFFSGMMSFPVILSILCVMFVFVILFLRSTFTSMDTLPNLNYKESALNSHLLNRSSFLRRPFRPLNWIKNNHLQTLVGLFRPQLSSNFEREYLQMPDRGVIALDWVVNIAFHLKRNSPIIIVFPPITGDGGTVANICQSAGQRGYRVVVFNYRGHNKSFLTTKKLTSFGDPMDVRQTVLFIRQKHPRANIVSLAVGSGSTVLFSYLGEYGSSTRLKAAAFISPVYDTTDLLSQGLPRFYQFLYLIGLKRILLRHAQALSEVVGISEAVKTFDVMKFQEHVYCKFYGIGSIDQFLERNNPMRDVDDISVPVMCLNSLDDPICQKHDIPFDIFQFYPNMLLVTTDNGGHCGFLENISQTSWGETFALDYLSNVLEFTSTQEKYKF